MADHPIRGKFLRAVLVAGLVSGLVGAAFLGTLGIAFRTAGPHGAGATVVVPKGAGLSRVAEILGKAGVISRQKVFTAVVRMKGEAGRLRAGEFRVPARASMKDILRILTLGEVIQHRLTIPEGLSVAEVLERLAADDILVGDPQEVPEEGTLLPETYYFARGETRSALLRRMEAAQGDLLDQLWPARAPNLPLSGPLDAVILASIVEKETALEAERGHIAAVFLNRLTKGMRLQSDPTVIYGLTAGAELGRSLTKSDLDSDTPYNTYRIAGLPPTAIANPGRASLEAVLGPPASTDLYFVADGSGGHVFAATLAEHNRNVARWRRIEQDRR
ncbi:MAG: endolytic transglycosylase MltG [Sphingomonadales bacterium]